MKFFPVNNKYINSQKNYLTTINNKIEGLQQYVKNFKPEWRVLNEYPEEVSQDELVSKGIIAPAKLSTQSGDKQSLIVFPAKLNYNEGVVNSFAGYDSVWIYYGNPENTKGWLQPEGYYDIPESALPTTIDVGRHTTFADLYVVDEANNASLVFDCRDMLPAEGQLSLSGIKLSPSEVFLQAAPPSLRKIIFDPAFNPELTYDGKMQELYPSYYVFSKFKNEVGGDIKTLLDSPEYKEKKNYLLARLVRGGSYYMWNFRYDPGLNKQIGVAYLEENATDRFGIKYLLDTDLKQKRFLISEATSEWENCEKRIFNAYFTNDIGDIKFNIKTKQGGVWTGSNLLNHEFKISTLDGVESIFLEEKREKGYLSLDKAAVPVYTETVTNGEAILLGLNIYLW